MKIKHSVRVLKVFMFLFVGGLVGLAYEMLGLVSARWIPLVILFSGLGAVACVALFVRSS
jgi:hypothetical protein